MYSFKIIADSACDLPQEAAEKYDISIVPYRITLDGENYFKERVELSIEDFYHALRTQDVFPKTSLPSVQDYIDVFTEPVEKGEAILCINLTSKFSGSYQSAVNARNMILEDHPDAKIFVMDSMVVTALQGALVLEAAKMRDNGFSVEEVYEKCEEIKNLSKVYLTVDSLKYLQKGGRIGKVSALAGGLLNIKPIIVFADGELIPVTKMRGRKKAVAEIIRLFKADTGGNADDYLYCIIHSDEKEEAEELKKALENDFDNKIPFSVFDIGVTIGAHIGPTVLGVGYFKKYDV